MLAWDLHANFARRQCLNPRRALSFPLSLLFGTRGSGLLLLSLASCVGFSFALGALRFPSLLLFLILLQVARRDVIHVRPDAREFLCLIFLATLPAAAAAALRVRHVCGAN